MMKLQRLDQVKAQPIKRLVTGGPWDPAWGGGIVPGSTTLIGGTAGMGRTTLCLQIASALSVLTKRPSLLINGECTASQLQDTALRLKLHLSKLMVADVRSGYAFNLDRDIETVGAPACVVIDSLTAVCGKDEKASLSLFEQVAAKAHRCGFPAFVILHMNKQGDFRGFYALQHLADIITTLFPLSETDDASLRRAGHKEDVINNGRSLITWKSHYGPSMQDHYLMMTPEGLQALPTPAKKAKGKAR